ncbi:hypothetical protein [Geodermatophilus sp. DSM 44513]|uniref:hypothetical protein n=1 Tax=Geodermatophilus sp. DSM 44513 TaxID=1528104 RepID=UPI0012763D86|nr:hypothetical protein [Geodermatophilus sp. DSM 44513]WNV75072.1 hypothetical protein RTG05_19090 [Geodermatophilus sp. DSM 44513]
MTGFPHPSRPGFFGTTFPEPLRRQVASLCDAMLPGDGVYPPGSSAQVPWFMKQRASPEDRARLQALADRFPLDSPQDAAAALRELEQSDAWTFGWIREYVYHGYYASPRVLAAMHDRGYDYHGAPQPLGYALPGTTAGPAKRRGSYVPTTEVSRATA